MSEPADHVDVLIVGAGLSGIGAAYHLQSSLPDRTYAILEARDASGGTWDLFRYPGVRSDSDLHTFGYGFQPWIGEQVIADGPAILRYIRETASEHGIDRHIRFGRRAVRAAWSGARARWTIEVLHRDTGETERMTAGWLFCATGYYRYDEGFTPVLPGLDRFEGQVVHPQFWPEDLDVSGRRVVVVGSGATAVTLLPALARTAEHVTMLQRSPGYTLSVPSRDTLAERLRRYLGEERGHALTRRKNVFLQSATYKLCRRHPALMRRVLRHLTARQLPPGFAVDTHFSPRYDPWDQRLCIAPDGDLFRALRSGRASIETDRIETFTPDGVELASGKHLEADTVVTATGLNLLAFGGMELIVDGRKVALPDTLAYKGTMLSGVPNFAYAIGYTNASWTLKVDLVCEFFCRVLSHMDSNGHDACVPEPEDPGMPTRPLLDFSAGYVLRSLDDFPRQGTGAPWQLAMDYGTDVRVLRRGPVDDGTLRFSSRPRAYFTPTRSTTKTSVSSGPITPPAPRLP